MDQASIDRRVLAQRDADGWLFLVEAAQAGARSGLEALRTAWRSAVRSGRRAPVPGGVPR